MTEDLLGTDNNGSGSSDDLESYDELKVVEKKLSELSRPGAVTFSTDQLSLFKQMVQVPDTIDLVDKFERLLPILDFKSDLERAKNVKAFDEAVRLGLDLRVNIRWALSYLATNRGGNLSNRIGALLKSFTSSKQDIHWSGSKNSSYDKNRSNNLLG